MKYIRIGNEIKKVVWASGKCLGFEGKSKKGFCPISKTKVDKFADDLLDLLDKIVLITTPSLNMMISHDLWNDKRTAIEVFDEDQRKDRFGRDFSDAWARFGLTMVLNM